METDVGSHLGYLYVTFRALLQIKALLYLYVVRQPMHPVQHALSYTINTYMIGRY